MAQHIVHVENILHHSAYKHVFVYRGSSLPEMMAEFHTFFPHNPKVKYEVYNARFGTIGRKCIDGDTIPDEDEFLYVFLRLN
jgi:hypothetical protein